MRRQVRSEIESMRHDRCTEDTDRLVLESDITSMREGGLGSEKAIYLSTALRVPRVYAKGDTH